MNLNTFEELSHHRSAIRDFSSEEVPQEVLEKIMRITQQSPSGYNLQPTHFYIVKSRQHKESIFRATLRQKAIVSAPVTIVFAADRNASENHFDRVYDQEVDEKILSEEEHEKYKLFVDMSFSHKPMGMGWVAKAFFAPFLHFFSPMPELPAIYKKPWLHLHVGLSAMTCMLAAESAGLSTCPISSFDQRRLKKALKIPRNFDIPLIMALGYKEKSQKKRIRLPLESVIHWR